MRQIDNYTDKEREVLALKGMTAPRTASERGKAKCTHNAMVERKGDNAHAWQCADCGHVYGTDESEDIQRLPGLAPAPAPNKAQHSPLPWRTVVETDFEPCSIYADPEQHIADIYGNDKRQRAANAALIVRAVNHADKLAEACQMFLTALNKDQLNHAYAFTQKALSAYEKESK